MLKWLDVTLVFISLLPFITSDSNLGPDPWDNIQKDTSPKQYNHDVPPDLRMPLQKKPIPESNMVNGEWFFKRAVAIMLNGGQTKVNDDGSVDISLLMKFEPEQWQILNEYTKFSLALNEEMFRRAIAYVEEAIYKPSLSEKIVVAWSEYIHTFVMTNRIYIVWSFGILAAMGLTFWLYKHMSHKHVVILVIILLYIYEVIISYKEAEKQELDRFLSAVNKCSWYFWKSSCEVSPPDPIVFMNHMKPMKIGLRMFTTILSEPMLALSGTVNTMIHDITDKLWFPFDVVLHSILIISINILIIVLFIMVIFNYILNIPFDLNLVLGSLRVRQRKRTMSMDNSNNNTQRIEDSDKISGATLDKILDVFSRAIDNSKNSPKIALNEIGHHVPKIKRSSSTGRLPNSSLGNYDIVPTSLEINVRKRNIPTFMIGGGDNKHNF